MDYQEAIEILKKNKPTSDPRRCGKELCTACDVAISAMQEMQEYKQKLNNAYGECDDLLRTVVDGLVRHEGIDIGNPIKSSMLTDEHVDLWEGYKQIGTLEEVRESVEKQKAKKPLVGGNTDKLTGDIRICPCCCGIVGIDDMRADYCADCGQHIDWSEVEE